MSGQDASAGAPLEPPARPTTGRVEDALLRLIEPLLPGLIEQHIDEVDAELGLHPLPVMHQWPADTYLATREFLQCVATDSMDRLQEPNGIFAQIGREWARTGVDFELLATAMRHSHRITHGLVHRALLKEPEAQGDPEGMFVVLDRIYAGGEQTVAAARLGFERGSDHAADDLARQLGGLLILGGDEALTLAHQCGWDEDATVCAIVTSPESAAVIRRDSDCRVGYFPRSRDVVLLHPVAEDKLATTLRPLLTGHTCCVGPALPMLEAAQSLDLAVRAQLLGFAGEDEVTFADDVMLEIACSADRAVVDSLRRTYLTDVDSLPDDQRITLLHTLLEWLRHWGQRAKVAEALDVHPQTVSHRIHRLRDLLSDELDDPVVRAELLVLLTAMSVRDAWRLP